MRYFIDKRTGLLVPVKNSRFVDLAPVFMILLPVLMSIAKGAVVSAVGNSIQQKVIDPLVDKAIADCKSLIADRGKNEAYTSAIMRNLSARMKKLSAILKREKAPIANKVAGLASKISKEAEKKPKKDSLIRDVATAEVSNVITSIAGQLTGLAVIFSSPVIKQGLENIVKFITMIKDAIVRGLHKIDPTAITRIPKMLKKVIKNISWKNIKESTQNWVSMRKRTAETMKSVDSMSKKLAKQVIKLNKSRTISPVAVEAKKNAVEALRKIPSNAIKSKKGIEEFAKKYSEMVMFAHAKHRAAIEKMEKSLPEGFKTVKKLTRNMPVDDIVKEVGVGGFNSLLKLANENPDGLKAVMKSTGKGNLFDLIKQFGVGGLKGMFEKENGKGKGSGKKGDSLRRDSRLKRSVKWPGRATSWEIKMALGVPENVPISKDYQGMVTPRGDVIVTNRSKPNSRPITISSEELNRLAMLGQKAGGALNSAQQVWVGRQVGLGEQRKIEQTNQSKIMTALSGMARMAALAGSVIGSIGAVTQGVASTVNAVNRARANVNMAMTSFNAAQNDLNAAKA